MEKPRWPLRSSRYEIESPHLRIRKDEIELPGGEIVPYYVRESNGYVMIFALTAERNVVMVRQYRYGNDSIELELPAGSIDAGEDPLSCAQRELTEETGFVATRWEPLVSAAAEPVRSNSVMHAYLAFDAIPKHEQRLDPTEIIEPCTITIERLLAMLREGTIGSVACMAVAYAALDRLRLIRV